MSFFIYKVMSTRDKRPYTLLVTQRCNCNSTERYNHGKSGLFVKLNGSRSASFFFFQNPAKKVQ